MQSLQHRRRFLMSLMKFMSRCMHGNCLQFAAPTRWAAPLDKRKITDRAPG